MKIIVIGGKGTIGRAIVEELTPRHEIIIAGRHDADIDVDIQNEDSIIQLYKTVGEFDAVISATGNVHFQDFKTMNESHYQIGLNNKLMGQVRLVMHGLDHIKDGGSFTLTSGVINREPIRFGASAAMVNGAIDAYVKAAAIEMPRSIRINAVSPTVITEAMKDYEPYFRGFEPVPAATAARAYSRSVEGLRTGHVFVVG